MTWLPYRVKIPMVVVVLVGDRKRGDAVTLKGVLPGPLLIGTACVLGAVWRSAKPSRGFLTPKTSSREELPLS
ncbi:hypothetical protein J6590_076218 [Homalodisca vitripennis]|nr:hypothetical protein J6590_076218 [Homalodisca vitripennis]